MIKTASWADTTGGVVITLVGEVDFGNADELTAVVGEVFAQRRPGLVRVDVGRVPFIDSTGLSALISIYRAALAVGAAVVLVDPTPFLLSLLQITGLMDLFPVDRTQPTDATLATDAALAADAAHPSDAGVAEPLA